MQVQRMYFICVSYLKKPIEMGSTTSPSSSAALPSPLPSDLGLLGHEPPRAEKKTAQRLQINPRRAYKNAWVAPIMICDVVSVRIRRDQLRSLIDPEADHQGIRFGRPVNCRARQQLASNLQRRPKASATLF